MPDELIVLGSASGLPSKERFSTAYVLRVTGKLFLIDCGAPVSSLLYQFGFDPLDIQAIFLSHWHMDHVAGLGLFLTQNHVLKRSQALKVYGPRGTKGKISRLLTDSFMLSEDLNYKLKVANIKHREIVKEALLSVRFFRTQHLEKPKHKTHFGRKATALGMVLQGPGWKVLYSGDLASPQELAPYVAGCDLLIHELAHVAPKAVAEFAEAANIPAVLISHIHPKFDRSPGKIVKAFSERYSGNLMVAHDGTKVQLNQSIAAGTISKSVTVEQRKPLKGPSKAPERELFLDILQKELKITPATSHKILTIAQKTLIPKSIKKADKVQSGQVEIVAAPLDAPTNISLTEAERVHVRLTLDAGQQDTQFKAEHGPSGLRRYRLLRLQQEAVEQGGILTQSDLARLLNVSVRTIRRDIKILATAGHSVRTRGQTT